jgi:putative FmdB family regulatory protein
MPIYEYLCRACRKRSAILVLSLHNPPAASCRHCGSIEVDRLLSRFSAPKSEEARLESLADTDKLGDLDENDPQSMARFMKKMGTEMGEDMGGEIDAMLESSGEDACSSEGTGDSL